MVGDAGLQSGKILCGTILSYAPMVLLQRSALTPAVNNTVLKRGLVESPIELLTSRTSVEQALLFRKFSSHLSQSTRKGANEPCPLKSQKKWAQFACLWSIR